MLQQWQMDQEWKLLVILAVLLLLVLMLMEGS